METDLERAIGLLGPLEGRVMSLVWTAQVGEKFAVRDVHSHLPDLAYTTVMTTMQRLAKKGMLASRADPVHPAHEYRAAETPGEFLIRSSGREAAAVIDRYGEAGLAAFAACLDDLTPEQQRRLKELRR